MRFLPPILACQLVLSLCRFLFRQQYCWDLMGEASLSRREDTSCSRWSIGSSAPVLHGAPNPYEGVVLQLYQFGLGIPQGAVFCICSLSDPLKGCWAEDLGEKRLPSKLSPVTVLFRLEASFGFCPEWREQECIRKNLHIFSWAGRNRSWVLSTWG